MTGLIVIAGLLALASGLLKIFGKGRRAGEVPLWALLELLTGVSVPLFSLETQPSQTVQAALLFFTLGLIFLSSFLQVARTRARRQHREETEAARLNVYVKFLSEQMKADGSELE